MTLKIGFRVKPGMTNMKPSISTVVLARNEENNIERCLASVSWCDEIIIVDDYSEDEILKKITNYKLSRQKRDPAEAGQITNKKLNIKIFQRHLHRDFAAQRNFGLEKASGDWVLFVDADEIISEELKKEIISLYHSEFISESSRSRNKFGMTTASKHSQNDNIGYYLRRKDYFLGKWLRYGETASVKLLRLARRNAGRWQGRVHETWNIDGEIGEFKNPLLHYPHQTVAAFLKEISWYTDIVAQYWSEQGRKIAAWEIVCYPLGKFLQNYILRLGILDGIAGLIMAFMMSFHSFLVRGKLWLSQHKNG